MHDASAKKEAEEVRSLISRKVRPFRNWSEWLDRWNQAEVLEEMLGLLHAGFQVPYYPCNSTEKEYTRLNCVIFYLAIADGWQHHHWLENKDDRTYFSGWKGEEFNCESKLRRMLASKAFKMLCQNFFGKFDKPQKDAQEYSQREWLEIIHSEKLLPAIQNFFRRQGVEGMISSNSIRNLPGPDWKANQSPEVKTALGFLLNLAEVLWEWKEASIQRYCDPTEDELKKQASGRARVEAAKLWMIEVLSMHEQLGFLSKRMLSLNAGCIEKLKEIAMRTELSSYSHHVSSSRPVETLEEAILAGSREALFLKRHEVAVAEDRRLREIKEAERQKNEAEEKLRKITRKTC